MQTRRDQLQAYRFQNRRALAALVTGDANVVEPPMRRLTVMTIAGIMIAILVAVVFALLGKFSPDTGDAWKEAGAVIIDNNTGATYLYDPDTNELHPVVNYTSAVLAIQGNGKAHTVHVDADDVKSAKVGEAVGIRGLPYTLPSASGLISGPWTACSNLSADDTTGRVSVRTVVSADSTAKSHALAATSPVLVRDVQDDATYLLVDGQRHAISPEVAAGLQLTAQPLPVGTSFVNGVPAGAALRAPTVPGAGAPSTLIAGARVGELVRESSGAATAVVLRDGFLLLSNRIQIALLQTVRVDGRPITPATAPDNVITANLSKSDGSALVAGFAGLPTQIDTASPLTQRATGACAVYRSATPTFALLTGTPVATSGQTVHQSSASTNGRADQVVVPSDGAALIRADRAKTLSVVDPSGRRFALGSGALTKIGYDGAKPQTLAAQLVKLIPPGPAMDPGAASSPAGS